MGKDIQTGAYVQGPSPDDPGKKEDVPEATEFDNLLRVDQSDEPPKEKKKSKTEEEEEKKEKKTPETEVPTSEAFRRFMDGKSDEGAFKIQSPQKTRGIQTTAEVAAPEPKAKSAKKAPAPEQEELVYTPAPEEPAPTTAEAKPAPAPQPTTSAKQETTTQAQTTSTKQESTPAVTPSAKEEPSSSQKYSEPEESQTTTTTTSTTTSNEGQPPTTDTEPEVPGDTPNTLESTLEEAAPLPSLTEEVETAFEDMGLLTTPAEKKASFEKVDFPIDPAAGKVVEEDKPKTDKEVFMAEIGAFPEGTVPTALPEAPIPGVTPTSYTTLSKQVRELFDYMVGTIIVKKDSDKTTTTVMVNLKGSVFDGSKIVLTRYATSPDQLNVQLQGNPQAVNLFSKNLEALRRAFMEKKMNVHLLSPNLLDEYFEKQKKKAKTVSRKKKH